MTLLLPTTTSDLLLNVIQRALKAATLTSEDLDVMRRSMNAVDVRIANPNAVDQKLDQLFRHFREGHITSRQLENGVLAILESAHKLAFKKLNRFTLSQKYHPNFHNDLHPWILAALKLEHTGALALPSFRELQQMLRRDFFLELGLLFIQQRGHADITSWDGEVQHFTQKGDSASIMMTIRDSGEWVFTARTGPASYTDRDRFDLVMKRTSKPDVFDLTLTCVAEDNVNFTNAEELIAAARHLNENFPGLALESVLKVEFHPEKLSAAA